MGTASVVLWSTATLLFIFVLTAVPTSHAQDANSQPTRPNIVFIMADDLGYNDVSYHNRQGTYTPTIDTLATEGVRLENYYVQPICSPTRSEFLSGRAQIHTGLQHKIIQRNQPLGLPLDSPTLADKLKEARYATDMVGKWHLGLFDEAYLPTSRGFDSFYGLYLGSGDHFSHKACASGRCSVDLHNDTATDQRPDFGQSGVYSTHLFTDEAIRVIEHRSKEDNPFFLYLSYQAVHGPLQVPAKYRRELRQKLNRRKMGGPARQKFIAMTYAMDMGIKRVVDSLKDNGVWNNTVLVFSTDNGGTYKVGGSNLPLRGGKGTFFEGGVRGISFVNSPLLNQKGYVNNELMHVRDWFPTFMALANGNLNGTRDVNGFNQWETISQRAPSPREEILFNIDPLNKIRVPQPISYPFDTRVRGALRKGDYKIITGVDFTPSGMAMYNVKEDPTEMYELSELPAFRSKVNELLDSLQSYNETAVPVWYPKRNRIQLGDAWGPWDYVINFKGNNPQTFAHHPHHPARS